MSNETTSTSLELRRMIFLRLLLAGTVFAGALILGKSAPWQAPDIPGATAPSVANAAGHRDKGVESSTADNSVESSRPSVLSLESLVAEPSSLRRRVLARRHFDKLESADFAGQLATVMAADDAEILGAFFASWTTKSPAVALDAANTLPAAYRSSILARILSLWARADHAAASKWSERLTGREKSAVDHMLRQIASAASARSSDPAAASPTQSPKEQFWSHVSLSANGIGISNKETKALPALRAWVRENPDEASQAFLKSPILCGDEAFLRAVHDEWKAKDPSGANRFISALPSEAAHKLILSLALEASDKDVAAARLIAERLPTPNQRAMVLTQVGAKVAANDPTQAPGWIESLQQTNPSFLPMSIFREWFKADPDKAIEALGGHPAYQKMRAENPDTRVVANYLDFRPWVEKNPEAAATFLAALPKADRATSLYNLGNQWVEKDAPAAIRWARSLPQPDAQDEALRQFTFSWAKSNALGVTQHLNALPAGSSGRTAAIEGFAFASFDVDPDAVLHWTRAVPDESKRLDILTRAYRDWRRNNATAASDWLNNVADLQPKERAAFANE